MKIYMLREFIPERSKQDRVITFFLTPYATEEKKNFRCISCGKMIMQYEGEVMAGYEGGDTPDQKSALEILCVRCKIIYRFIS